jgi:glutamine synthetase
MTDFSDAGAAEDVPARVAALSAAGVDTVAVAIVDPAGVTRVKAFPLSRLPAVMRSGMGFSRAISVFSVDDVPVAVPGLEGPIGDLRLLPDLGSCVPLDTEPGLAWVPADQYDQEGRVWPTCPRSFLRRMVRRLADRGLHLQVGWELEWFQGVRGTDRDAAPVPASSGPGYSAAALASTDFPMALLRTCYRQGIPVEQFHAEVAPGQFELALAPLAPVAAADTTVLVRQLVRQVSRPLGQEPSFSPMTTAGGVGNGAHVHVSVWERAERDGDGPGRNLFAGDGPGGLTREGAAFLAGVLRELPALTAVTSPSPVSSLRLRPQQWAGAFQAWGVENREVALRVVPGMVGHRATSSNVEYKPIDPAANPYLALGAIAAAGLAGLDAGLELPDPVPVDPATLTGGGGEGTVSRLPGSLRESADAFEASAVLREAMGDLLHTSFLATRRAEDATYRHLPDAELAAALRWRY